MAVEGAAISEQLGAVMTLSESLVLQVKVLKRRGDFVRMREIGRRAIRIVREAGTARFIPFHLQALGLIAREQRQLQRAARLFGAAAAILETHVRAKPPFIPMEFEPCQNAVRAELGEQAFADLFAQGQGWSIDEAVGYGLEGRAEG